MDSLEKIYSEIPKIDCQKKCAESCGPVPMSHSERVNLENLGIEMATFYPSLNCNQLTELGLCSIHENRPLACRLWGVVEGMKCPWGCKPERYLTDDQAHDLISRSLKLRTN